MKSPGNVYLFVVAEITLFSLIRNSLLIDLKISGLPQMAAGSGFEDPWFEVAGEQRSSRSVVLSRSVAGFRSGLMSPGAVQR